MKHFPECPKCEQRALYADEAERPPLHGCPDCECHDDAEPPAVVRCAACFHVIAKPSATLVANCVEAMDASSFIIAREFRDHWRNKLKSEREKVSRLQEGRW